MTANDIWSGHRRPIDATSAQAMRAKRPVSSARRDYLRVTALAISREELVRQRVDLLAQIRALSRRLESIDRQLDDIAHTEAAHTGD
jgi:hypothetical protein